jgi:hypothetical protein
MVSMLTPSSAVSRATTPKASALIGLPSTTMVWVDGSRSTVRSSLRSIVTSSPTPRIAAVTSSCSAASPAASSRPATSTASVRRPRTTTCSTFSRSTSWRASTSKSADVTPG